MAYVYRYSRERTELQTMFCPICRQRGVWPIYWNGACCQKHMILASEALWLSVWSLEQTIAAQDDRGDEQTRLQAAQDALLRMQVCKTKGAPAI